MQAKLLHAIRADLDLVIAPTLTSAEARTAAQLASEMLSFLLVGMDALEDTLPALKQRLRQLVQRAEALAAEAGEGAGPAAGPGLVGSELTTDPEYTQLKGRAADALARVFAARSSRKAGREDALGSLAREAVQVEQAEQLTLQQLVNADMADRRDPLQAVETELTRERLEGFVKARLGQPDAGSVERVERIPGGYSKDTWRVRLSRGINGHRDLILRRDLPFGPGENTVVEEFELLERLADAGLLVPRPLWCEPDASFVGRPFLLFPQYPGNAVFGEWNAPAEVKRAVCFEVARLMAKLHGLDPQQLGLPGLVTNRSPVETVQAYVRSWRDKWQRRRSHPSLVLMTAFDWLERNAPAGLPRVSLVHGDVTFRNTLIHEGHLTALLDWEFWHLGDPMEDLSYFRLVAEPHVAWSEIMQAYQEAGGEVYDPARAAFYEVWRSVRNGTTTTTAWHGFLNGYYPASKAAYQGVSLYRLFLRDVAARLEAVTL
ncbi:MAG: phosphotransferase family protein [Proteobacteria bacterium]|nr:phosphotransferase family protein [Pseudomonadota bacterium]